VDAVVLAYAGMRRLGVADRATEILDADWCIPAVGQGALGIECRDDDGDTIALLRATHHEDTGRAVAAERGVLVAVEGSCKIPVAAHATRDGTELRLQAMLASEDGSNVRTLTERRLYPATDTEAAAFGREIGRRLLEARSTS
jgi:hydroxymethylbilane synthase